MLYLKRTGHKVLNTHSALQCPSVLSTMTNHIRIILLVAAVAVGIIFSPIIAPAYWDELAQYDIGAYNFNQYASLFDKVFGISMSDQAYSDFEHFRDRDYGSIFEVFIALLGKAAGSIRHGFSLADLIILKHFAVYLVFILGTCGVYSIARRRIGSSLGGLLAAAMFFLSPRLFGNAFYNSKDIVFLSFFVLSVNYVLWAADNCKIKSVLMAALFTALAVSVRVVGIFSLFLGVFVWIISWRREGRSIGRISAAIGSFLVMTLLLIYVFYPFLWPSPLSRASEVISNMSTFTRHGDGGLFDGAVIRSSEQPFYVVRWMAVTLPFLFIAASLCGQIQAGILVVRRTLSLSLWKNSNELCDYVIFVLGLAPVLVSIFKHPWLYDGWRHLYFLMPFLSVSATSGIFNAASVFASARARSTVAVYFAASVIVESIIGIFCFFPYPNCYFNASAGTGLFYRYDVDYSGTAVYEALRMIISFNQNTSRPALVATDGVAISPAQIRLKHEGSRISLGEKIMPDYVISLRSVPSETESTLYHEFATVKTWGGEVVLRILAPNDNMNSVCGKDPEKCRFL